MGLSSLRDQKFPVPNIPTKSRGSLLVTEAKPRRRSARGVRAVQDTVLYGDPADPIEDVELEDDRGLATMATMPEQGLTMGRHPNEQDADDNAVDFVSNATPTPGAPNAVREDGAESDGTGGGGWRYFRP